MVKLYPIFGAVLSVVALIIVAIGASTNRWVYLSESDSTLNPSVVNSKLQPIQTRLGVTQSTTKITYSLTYFGLWFGCHKEHRGAVTCAYIGSKCYSDVCWIRRTAANEATTCQDERVAPVKSCVSYQVVRAMLIIGIIFLVGGAATQVVSLLTVKRALAMLAGFVVFIAGLFIMVAFAVFYSENWRKSGLSSIGGLGYSFILVVVSWPLALTAGLISCCAASMGLRHKEQSEYSASNY